MLQLMGEKGISFLAPLMPFRSVLTQLYIRVNMTDLNFSCFLVAVALGCSDLVPRAFSQADLGRGLFSSKSYSSITSVYLKYQWLQLLTPAPFLSPAASEHNSSLSHINSSVLPVPCPAPPQCSKERRQALSLGKRRKKYTQAGEEAYGTGEGMAKMNMECFLKEIQEPLIPFCLTLAFRKCFEYHGWSTISGCVHMSRPCLQPVDAALGRKECRM